MVFFFLRKETADVPVKELDNARYEHSIII